MNTASESCLIARCREGDAAAWDEIFDRHYAATGRFVFQLAPDFTPEDVEEICQETFLTVIKSILSFHGTSQFQTWLFRIAANKSRDYRERLHAAKRGGGQVTLSLQAEDCENGLTIDPPSTAAGPDAHLLNAERVMLLRQALDQLGEPCREMIELRYFGDLSYEEIAQTVGLKSKTVSSRLSRCLARLEEICREKLSREKPTPFPV